MSFRIARLCLCAVLLICSACTLHDVPENPTPMVAGTTEFSVASEESKRYGAWWDDLGNDELNDLIRKALTGNLTIRQAAARVRQSQMLYRRARASENPFIDGVASAESSHRDSGGTDTLRASLELIWEVDLWKRLESNTAAALYDIRTRSEDYHAFRLIISSEVALAYYDAMEQRLQLALLEEQIKTSKTLLELTEFRVGRVEGATVVDVLQQREQLESARAQIPVAQAQLRLAENRLDVLLGRSPDGCDAVTKNMFPKLEGLPEVGVPANLLIQRPDLRAEKNALVAVDYRIASAMADRYPRVRIGASLEHLNSPMMSQDIIRSAIASAVMPIFDSGDTKAEVERRRAIFDEQLLRFSQAYLIAIQEVENAMYRELRQRELLATLTKQRDIARETLKETRFRYSKGLINYLPVLAAVQSLQRVERTLLREQRELVENRVLLYRAIGGKLPKE